MDRIVNRKYFSEADGKSVIHSILEALDYCHKRGIPHRDLKLENILLKDINDDTSVKISDFGYAKSLDDGLSSLSGAQEFIAPEVIVDHVNTQISDMWSLGVISYILLTGNSPFDTFDGARVYIYILSIIIIIYSFHLFYLL